MYFEEYAGSGVGVNASDVNWDYEKIVKIAKSIPILNEVIEEQCEECDISYEEFKVSDFDYYESTGPFFAEGEYAFILDVISENEGICFSLIEDCIVLPARMPWKLNDKEKDLTFEKLEELFKKYIKEDLDFELETFYFSEN